MASIGFTLEIFSIYMFASYFRYVRAAAQLARERKRQRLHQLVPMITARGIVNAAFMDLFYDGTRGLSMSGKHRALKF